MFALQGSTEPSPCGRRSEVRRRSSRGGPVLGFAVLGTERGVRILGKGKAGMPFRGQTPSPDAVHSRSLLSKGMPRGDDDGCTPVPLFTMLQSPRNFVLFTGPRACAAGTSFARCRRSDSIVVGPVLGETARRRTCIRRQTLAVARAGDHHQGLGAHQFHGVGVNDDADTARRVGDAVRGVLGRLVPRSCGVGSLQA